MEAFNEAVQKWIPVDPLVTRSLAKAFKFEPPASDPYNSMSYVVAFEEDASARDVTRRYAKAFNAKTRKIRVESTRNGEDWWKKVLNVYERPFLEDRDEIEISELTAKSAAEPMPRNVQDFKDHPIYALERHLRQNEVIHPKRKIGQVGTNVSSSKNQVLEPVYRRSDVHALRSANGWYRLGRDIKMGEQPLKHVRARRNKFLEYNDEDETDEGIETGLYARFQTELYKPPPVVGGRIPKNIFGNLDIYVPSMVPPGASHVKHRDSAQAAEILGIDYTYAVTGFEFKGRHGTAVYDGIVIANEFREALDEVISGLEDERLQADLEARSAEAIQTWKHFLLKLRIAERVKGYAVEDAEDEGGDDQTGADVSDGDYEEPNEGAGGFFPESDQGATNTRSDADARLTTNQDRISEQSSTAPFGTAESLGGGFLPDKFVPDSDVECSARTTTATSRTPRQSRYVLVVSSDDKPKTEPEMTVNANAPSREDGQAQSNIGKESPVETAPEGQTGSPELPVPVESFAEEAPMSANGEMQSRAPSPEADVEAVSLLSHDPEDEDAIPEWLV